MGRLMSVVTFLLTFFALVASLVCLFSGTSDTFMANAQMMTLNISQIGETPLFNTSSSNCKRGLLGDISDDLSSAFNKTSNGVHCATSSLKNGLNSLLSSTADSVADALNLPDFFDVHVMNFCQGYYIPRDYVQKGISNPERNVTTCSQRSTNFTFAPTQSVQDALPKGVTLEDIKWPKAITDAENALKLAMSVFIIFYIASAVTSGLSMAIGIWGIFSQGKAACVLTMVNTLIAFLSFIIASAASTVFIVKSSSVISEKGAKIGIAAQRGSAFLGMTWGGTIALLVAFAISTFQFKTIKRRAALLSGKNY